MQVLKYQSPHIRNSEFLLNLQISSEQDDHHNHAMIRKTEIALTIIKITIKIVAVKIMATPLLSWLREDESNAFCITGTITFRE